MDVVSGKSQNRMVKKECQTEVGSPIAWGLIVDGPLAGDENMRRDREALESQREHGSLPKLRLYRWVEPTLSFGRLQSRETAQAMATALGARAVVQRPTGGGMVFHDSDISFSIVWRRDQPGLPPCIKNMYRLFHEAIASEFRAQGMDVTLHQAEGAKRSPPGACYQEFSQDDIIWKGQKLVGGALRVTSWGRLYQGNLKISRLQEKENWGKSLINAFKSKVFLQLPPGAVSIDTAVSPGDRRQSLEQNF